MISEDESPICVDCQEVAVACHGDLCDACKKNPHLTVSLGVFEEPELEDIENIRPAKVTSTKLSDS